MKRSRASDKPATVKRVALLSPLEGVPPEILDLILSELSLSDAVRLRCSHTMRDNVDTCDSVLRNFARRATLGLMAAHSADVDNCAPAIYYAARASTFVRGPTGEFCRSTFRATHARATSVTPATLCTALYIQDKVTNASLFDYIHTTEEVAVLVIHMARARYTLRQLRQSTPVCIHTVYTLANLVDLDPRVTAFREDCRVDYLGARAVFDATFAAVRCTLPFDPPAPPADQRQLWEGFCLLRRNFSFEYAHFRFARLHAFFASEFERVKRSPPVKSLDNKWDFRLGTVYEDDARRAYKLVAGKAPPPAPNSSRSRVEDLGLEGSLNSLHFTHVSSDGTVGFALCGFKFNGRFLLGVHSLSAHFSDGGFARCRSDCIGVVSPDGAFLQFAPNADLTALGRVKLLERDPAQGFALLQKNSLLCGWCDRDHQPRCTP